MPDPITAFGKKKSSGEALKPARKNILSPSEKAKIKPKQLIDPPKPYLSARDINREKIMVTLQQQITNPAESIDVILPRLHKVAENSNLPYKRRIISSSEMRY